MSLPTYSYLLATYIVFFYHFKITNITYYDQPSWQFRSRGQAEDRGLAHHLQKYRLWTMFSIVYGLETWRTLWPTSFMCTSSHLWMLQIFGWIEPFNYQVMGLMPLLTKLPELFFFLMVILLILISKYTIPIYYVHFIQLKIF